MPAALGLLLWLSLAGALRSDLEPPQHNSTEAGAARFASDYNRTAEIVLYESVLASWNYNTNLTAENAALQVGGGTGAMPPRRWVWGGWVTAEALGVVPFLPAGFCLSISGRQSEGGSCSPGAVGVCPKLAFREALPQNDSSGPRAESRLFLEVIPSSQHLPLSPFPELSVVPVPVPAWCHHIPVLMVLVWGGHQEPKVHTSSWVASGLSLPPLVPVSPSHGDKARGGKALQAVGN